MRRYSTAAKVGVFAVAMLVAAVVIYRFITRTSRTDGGYVVYALMDDAGGIAKHSQVKIAGIGVGNIESIRLQQGKARIDMRIREEVPLYDDATVAKVASSLLGEFYLAITPGTEGKRQLEDGDRIRVVIEGVTPDDIMRQVSDIARDIKRVTDAMAGTFGSEEGKQNLKDTLDNLSKVTDALNATVRENRESIRNILTNVENITQRSAPELQQILENVREVTREVREIVAQAEDGQPGEGGKLREIIERVRTASESLETTMKNVEEVTGRLERGEGTLGRLTKDETLINEVEGITETVGEFVGGLDRLQTIVVLRADYLFLASAVKSYVELRLQPREDKYYSIEIVNDPRGLTRIEQIDVESTNFMQNPAHYREIRTVTTNAFRFSLQFAQRFGPFTGRFGIKESTGGVGLDVMLFEDRFELRQDLFGFGEVLVPRFRVSLGYEFVRRLWLLGGVDDIFSDTRRDYFIGLQLKFNDRDLKSILPFAPGP